MSVSVETLSGLERKLTVSVPSEKIEEEVALRLRSFAPKAKVHGFRAGKVPLSVVKQRYSDSIRQDVARDMIQSTLYEALKENKLAVAGAPMIEPQQLEEGQDFVYTASLEVYPEIEIKELNEGEEVELVSCEVSDQDVDKMIDNLREQNKQWEEVSRPVQEGDKVVIDFVGYLEDKAFDGGQAKDHELIIGSGTMIPGFEEAIVGAEQGKTISKQLTFPEDYGHEDLAGKETRFDITVKKIMEGQLPELDDQFIKQFNIKEGGVEAFKKDIKENMVRELERRVNAMNRNIVFEKLLEKNDFDLPKALIDQEIEHLKHEMYHQIFGHQHYDDEKIPDFPRELFEEKATRRVKLGLLFADYVKKHEIIVDPERVDVMIEKLASAYEDPNSLRTWYKENKDRHAEIEALVMEDIVSEKVLERAKTSHKVMSYEDVVNPVAKH